MCLYKIISMTRTVNITVSSKVLGTDITKCKRNKKDHYEIVLDRRTAYDLMRHLMSYYFTETIEWFCHRKEHD